MIRPLRRRHLFFSILMLLGLPTMVIYGYLKSNNDSIDTTMTNLPKFHERQQESFPLEVWHKPHLWINMPDLNTRLLSNTTPDHELAIELTYAGTISQPDILLYWSPRSYSVKSGIGDSMVLLGIFDHNETTLYPLPQVARHKDGFLILYSLGKDAIVSEAPLVNPLK